MDALMPRSDSGYPLVVEVWHSVRRLDSETKDSGRKYVTSIFEMSLAPLNFENHFFVFDVGLQKSLFLNTNAINVEFSALVLIYCI